MWRLLQKSDMKHPGSPEKSNMKHTYKEETNKSLFNVIFVIVVERNDISKDWSEQYSVYRAR